MTNTVLHVTFHACQARVSLSFMINLLLIYGWLFTFESQPGIGLPVMAHCLDLAVVLHTIGVPSTHRS